MIVNVNNVIYQLKLPIPYDLREVNCYLMKGRKGFTVIDTGDCTEEAIAIWTDTISKGFEIEKVVITHNHYDHVGLAGWFQQEIQVPVWSSKKSKEELVKQQKYIKENTSLNPLGPFYYLHGAPFTNEEGDKYYKAESFQYEPDVLFEERQKIPIGDFMFETIWTPGHSPDHFSFYNRENQILIVGDLILNSMNPIVMVEKPGDNPLKDYFAALGKIANLPVKYVLTGHGELIPNLPLRLALMKSHYLKRWNQIYHAIGAKGSSSYEISQIVYGDHLPREREMSAFIQTITNLIYLHSIGCVSVVEREGKLYYYKEKMDDLQEQFRF